MNELFHEPYYAGAKAPPRLPETRAERRLKQVLTQSSKTIVAETVNRWNKPLRDAVRAATALKFTHDSGRVAATVSVEVIDGMPAPLAEGVVDIEPWQWWLVLNRPALMRSDQGLKLIEDHKNMLDNYLGDIAKEVDAIGTSRTFIAKLLGHSVEEDLLARFKSIEQDILGAYWIHASKIQIYWMPLTIFASVLNVDLGTLTICVLCHELVHAYTHRGIDLNRLSWETGQFISTDIYVKEGLAQYYTEHVMRGLVARLPDGLTTFLAKTERQSPPYNAYQDWLGTDRKPSLEATRLAMLEIRNTRPPFFDHESFKKRLISAQAQTSGREISQNS
jgi:hypothetical protein